MKHSQLKKLIKEEIQKILSETYQSNIDMYKEEFKKRGFKMIDEEYFHGGHDDIWYKEFPLGRFCVAITTWDLTAYNSCLLYTSPSPRDRQKSRMPSSA